jgi:hypothetical protein
LRVYLIRKFLNNVQIRFFGGVNTTICLKAITTKVALYGLRKQPTFGCHDVGTDMCTGRVRTLGSVIRVSGASGSATAEGDVFEGCTRVKPESHKDKWKIKNLLGGESGQEAHQVHFRARLKRYPTKKENVFTLMKILQSSHPTTYFVESV